MTTHLPITPAWVCGACGADWPCQTRRRELPAEYDGVPVSLALYLAAQLVDAAQEPNPRPRRPPAPPFPRLDAMSILRPGDEKSHHSDGSHKWIPPNPDYDQEVWDEQVRQHKHGHLRNERPRSRIKRLV